MAKKKDLFEQFSEATLSGEGLGSRIGRERGEAAPTRGRMVQMTYFLDEETKRRLGQLRLDRGGNYKDYVLQAVKEFLDRMGY